MKIIGYAGYLLKMQIATCKMYMFQFIQLDRDRFLVPT